MPHEPPPFTRPTPRARRAVTGADLLKHIARAILEAPGQGDLDALDYALAPDFRSLSPSRPPLDAVAYRAFLQRHRIAFPDLRIEVQDLIAEGCQVVGRWTATGTHRGDYFGVAPTGNPVSWTGITLFRFAGEQVREQWVQSDSLALLRQIGALRESMHSIK